MCMNFSVETHIKRREGTRKGKKVVWGSRIFYSSFFEEVQKECKDPHAEKTKGYIT